MKGGRWRVGIRRGASHAGRDYSPSHPPDQVRSAEGTKSPEIRQPARLGSLLNKKSFQSIRGLLLVLLAGCALFEEEEVIYLKKAVALHVTQAEVKQRLGMPRFTQSLPNGETLWRYQIRTNTGGDLNGPGESYCNQYTLRFDRQAILREWTHDGSPWRLEDC